MMFGFSFAGLMQRSRIAVTCILICAILIAGGGCNRSSATLEPPSPSTPKDSVRLAGKIAEVAPPETIQRLNRDLDRYRPQVKILTPKADRVLTSDRAELTVQVRDLPIFKDDALQLGPHLKVLLDDRLYGELYDPEASLALENLSPGTHTIRVFAARPWHESFKNEGAYAQVSFHVFEPDRSNNPDPKRPLLTYSEPQGTYQAEPILLDFYLTNAPLHAIAGKQTDDRFSDWRIRATVNGQRFILDRWQSIYLKGFKTGSNWVELELLDRDGNSLDNVYNDTVAIATYDPQSPDAKDALGRLMGNELPYEEALAMVDPNYQRSQPEPEPLTEGETVPQSVPDSEPEAASPEDRSSQDFRNSETASESVTGSESENFSPINPNPEDRQESEEASKGKPQTQPDLDLPLTEQLDKPTSEASDTSELDAGVLPAEDGEQPEATKTGDSELKPEPQIDAIEDLERESQPSEIQAKELQLPVSLPEETDRPLSLPDREVTDEEGSTAIEVEEAPPAPLTPVSPTSQESAGQGKEISEPASPSGKETTAIVEPVESEEPEAFPESAQQDTPGDKNNTVLNAAPGDRPNQMPAPFNESGDRTDDRAAEISGDRQPSPIAPIEPSEEVSAGSSEERSDYQQPRSESPDLEQPERSQSTAKEDPKLNSPDRIEIPASEDNTPAPVAASGKSEGELEIPTAIEPSETLPTATTSTNSTPEELAPPTAKQPSLNEEAEQKTDVMPSPIQTSTQFARESDKGSFSGDPVTSSDEPNTPAQTDRSPITHPDLEANPQVRRISGETILNGIRDRWQGLSNRLQRIHLRSPIEIETLPNDSESSPS